MGRRVTRHILRIGVPVLLLFLIFWFTRYYTTVLVWELRKLLPWLVALAIIVACTVVPVLVAGALGRRRHREPGEGVAGVIGTTGLVVGVVVAIGWLVWAYYQVDRTYAASAHVVSERVPDLAPRAPYLVGKAQAGPSLGDVPGDIADITYLPDSDRFATLVERRGWLAGYEVGFTQQIPLDGRGRNSYKCRFNSEVADARVSGWWGHNLGRLISDHQRWARFDSKDVYVYCNGDAPIVVVPLKRQVGFILTTERPAGVALYNGLTGKITITTDTTGVPGPSYPISLAARQRAGTHAMGGFADWWFGRSGWDRSNDGANSGNESEFDLNRKDGSGAVFVTPLTPRGSATSIVAVSSVPARHPGLGLAPMTIYRLSPSWASPNAIEARIKADYADACCYNDDQVFEIIPTGGDGWVATLGSEQALRYRVEGNGQLQGADATCLKTADGQAIRCGSRPAAQQQTQPVEDLTKLTNDQLADLQRRLADEVARRLRAK